MKIRVCSVGATAIYVHPVMVLYFLYAWISGHLLFICLATASILLHEGSHAIISIVVGNPPRSIELTPLGAVMRMDDDLLLPPLAQVTVILAGPVMTLLICVCTLQMVKREILTSDIGKLLFMSNISILLLNLLPVMPLDGGRLLTLILERFLPHHRVRQISKGTGYGIGAGLILLNLLSAWQQRTWNLSLAFAGCCLMYTAASSSITWPMEELRYFLERKIRLERQGSQKSICMTCLATESIARLIHRLPSNKVMLCYCLQPGSKKPLGCVDEFELVQYYLGHPSARIGDMLHEEKTN